MQLKLKRSQREGGLVSAAVIFCLDARVEFTPAEQQNIKRYKLQKQMIYNSEASQKHLAKAGMQMATGNALGSVKALGSLALAAMKLNISIETLQRGQHIECKSLDEVLGAEEALMTACQNLRGYLDTAATFDGREVLLDFSSDEPAVVAQTSTPAPKLIAAPPVARLEQETVGQESYAGVAPSSNEDLASFREAMTSLWNMIWNRGNPRRYVAVAVVAVLLVLFSNS